VVGVPVIVGVGVVVAAVVCEADVVVVGTGVVVPVLLLHAEVTSSAAIATPQFFMV